MARPNSKVDTRSVSREETSASASGGGLSAAALYTLVVLFFVNFLNYFDRVIVSVLLGPIRTEFELNDTMLGSVASAFTLLFAVMALPMGQVADSKSRKGLLAGGVGLWSLFTAGSGLATSFPLFFAARMGVGVGEATCTPAATSLIGDMVPLRMRAMVFGLFMLGFPLGTFSALMLGGQIAAAYGWRTAFFVAAAPGMLAVLLLLFCKEPPRGAQDSALVDQHVARPIWTLLSSPLLWSINFVAIALNISAYAMGTFLPSFFGRIHHLDVSGAGLHSAIVLGASGVIGLTLGGWIADKVAIGRAHGRALLGLICCLLAAPLVYFGLNSSDLNIATASMAAGWTFYFVYFVTALSAIVDQFDSRLRGRAIGLFVFCGSAIGGTVGAVLAGILSDVFAKSAIANGAAEAAAQAAGLQQSLTILVPGGLVLGAVGYGLAVMALRKRNPARSVAA